MTMTLKEVAEKLVDGCRTGQDTANLDVLYAADAVSVEAMPMEPGGSPETVGLDGIKGKHAWWNGAFEFMGGTIDGPFLHGDDKFAVVFKLSAKNRETGEVSDMEEVGIYHVADGKIVREEFFYTM